MQRLLRVSATIMTLTLMLMTWQLAAQTTPGAGESCLVSDTTGAAPLHLGPGPQRGVIGLIPLTGEFPAVGQITVESGVWYQLDRDEVLPNATVGEVWVAADTVSTSGDCANLPQTDAPPVVGMGPPPLLDAEGRIIPTPTPVPGLIPAEGLWTLTMNLRMSRVCEGVPGVVEVDTGEIYQQRQRTERLIIGPGNNNITFRFDVLTRVADSNSFFGDVTYETVPDAFMTLNMGSATFMFGAIDVKYVVDGFNCTATIPVIVEYNFPTIPGERGSAILPTPLPP